MFLTQGNAERGRLSPFQYGTAGTTTTTNLASQGGLLINIDSATGDIARTTDGWIEDEKYGIWAETFATTTSAEFDTAVLRTGTKTLKLSTTNATGSISAVMGLGQATGATIPAGNQYKYSYPVKGSTKYKLTCWVKTNNVATSSVYIQLSQFNSAGTRGTVTNSSFLTGTNDWTLLSVNVTTTANTTHTCVFCGNFTAGNISDAWFDVNSMKLDMIEEPVANSLTTPSPSLVSFTAVGSTDNIDQSQLTVSGDWAMTIVAPAVAQQILPTKSKFVGIVIRRGADTGVWTGTCTVKIVNDNAGLPGTTVLASYVLSNATWEAIALNTDYTINLPCNLTANGSTKYWSTLVFSNVTATEKPNIKVGGGGTGYGQLFAYGDGTTYAVYSQDLYFKSLYYKPTTNFKASQNNSTVSISADEEGFLDGSVVNLTTGSYSFNFSVGVNPNPVLWSIFETNTQVYLSAGIAGRPRWDSGYFTYKINTPVLNSDLLLTYTIINGVTVDYSFDNSTWLNLTTQTGTPTTTYNVSVPATGQDTVYVRFTRTSGSVQAYNFYGSSTFDTSSLSTLRNYPTNKDVIKQYSTTLGSATTSATYRATKWGFPAIEYNIAGLIGRYDMFGNANDTSGSGFNGTVTGATLTTDRYGNANRAYLFNGTTDYISMGDVMDVGTGDLSFSIWFKTTTSGVTQGLLTKSKFAGGNGRYGIQFIAGELYSFIDFDTGASIWKISVPETHYVDGNWHQAVVTIKRTGNITLYVDGVNKGTTDISAQSAVDCSSTNIFGIGAYQNVAGTAFDRHFFTGSIGQVRIFNRELSQAEVTYMYTSTGEEQSQYLDVDTTATGSTVAFSELGTSYTTVADGASLAITSTSTPNIFVKTNITANRLYVSSNDYNASSDKDGSLKQSVVYNVIQ